jgi:ethylbenzene dioxygenase beta subunit
MRVGEDVAQLRERAEAFLFLEARLLDGEYYADWLDRIAEDVHYWVPGIENRNRRDPQGAYTDGHMAYFDDTKADLVRRVARFTSDTAWAENPPTRHTHVVANVEAEPGERPGELIAYSVLVCHRWRYEKDEDVLYARREDVLRDDGTGVLLLARRKVLISHNILPAKNLNTFL